MINLTCACGHTQFAIQGQAKFRMICHCTICQRFNQSTHADVLIFNTKQITTPSQEMVKFTTYKAPPNVKRGTCVNCQQPAIEVFNMPLMPKLTLVPAGMFALDTPLPKPKAHMFYDKRVVDVDDDCPKVHGFMRSQLRFFRHLWFD